MAWNSDELLKLADKANKNNNQPRIRYIAKEETEDKTKQNDSSRLNNSKLKFKEKISEDKDQEKIVSKD